MRKSIFVAVPLALLALAAPAAAHGGHATTYKATVVALPGDQPTAIASEAAPGVRGEANLVDGPRRDKVQLQVKGLVAGGGYVWSVRSSAGGDACTGDEVDAFQYAPLTARRHGPTRARSRSTSFSAADGTSYAIVLTTADGTDVACGRFLSKADRRAAKQQRKTERRANREAHGKGGDKATGEDEQGDDDQQSGDEPSDDSSDDAASDD